MATSIHLPPPPDALDLEDARQRAALRVWAAEVRDRGPVAARRWARLLCVTLDLLPTVASPALRRLMEGNARALARKVREAAG
jgi:hypothetical protein